MTGPARMELGAAIGETDRGRLWRTSRGGGIVRVLDPRRCDEQFRDGLRLLSRLPRPNLVRIAGAGYVGDDYHIEYALETPWQTLEERLAACAHWTDRLAVLDRVCDVLPRWQESPLRTLGLSVRSILLTEHGGTDLAWLLPCPPVDVPTPRSFADLDTAALAPLAPERVRGVDADDRAQDMYALGTLAAQALARRADPLSGEDRVTAQARGVLLLATPERSDIPAAMRSLPAVEQLFQAIRHCRHALPAARPRRPSELRSALRAAADGVALAKLVEGKYPDEAMALLANLDRYPPEQQTRGLRLDAKLRAAGGDLPAAIDRLARAVCIDPDNVQLRQDLCDVRWERFSTAAGTDPAYHDDEALLRDIDWLKKILGGAELSLRAAAVYRRRGDLYPVAEQLYDAVQADGSDLQILYDYAACLRELRADAAAIRGIAARRIANLVEVGRLSEEEGVLWRHEFDMLLG